MVPSALAVEGVELWKSKAITWPAYEGFFGNVYHRPFFFDEPGDKLDGHTHNHPHITVLGAGHWLVRATRPNGEVIERSFKVEARRFVILHIRADVWHEITDLDGGGQMGCVFATRDATGDIMEAGERGDVSMVDMSPYV